MASAGRDRPLRRALVAAAVLAVAAVTAVGLVALVHDRAAPYIEASQRQARMRQLTAILGDVTYDNDPLTDALQVRDPEYLGSSEPLTLHRVRRAGRPVAVLVNALAPNAYSGVIHLLIAVDVHGHVLGVRVLDHRETPGLGDFIDTRRSDWIRGFDGRSLGAPPPDRWHVRKDGGDFDQYTGATVTSRAVVHGVHDALTWIERNRTHLFGAPAAPAAP